MSQAPKSKLNPNAKPFNPIPKAPPLPKSNTITPQQAGKKLDNSDSRTATNKSPAHNRSQHVGKTAQQLTARNKPIATSYLTKADQNKAAASLMNSDVGKQKKADLKNDSDGKTRTIRGTTDTGPAKPGANWNKTAVISKVSEKQSDGSVKTYNAKSTTHQMDLAKKNGKVNVQTTYSTKAGLTELPKPMAKNAPRPEKMKPGFDQSDFSNVTKNAKPGMVKPKATTPPTTKPAPKSYASALTGGKK